ncbi:MAG: OmpA family protein [Propionibacteriaceae bacterium]|nr:OmpA family protein [Propionibacteriaceae bacterium]
MARRVLPELVAGGSVVGLVATVGVGSVMAAGTIQEDLCERVRDRVAAESTNATPPATGRNVDLTTYDRSRTWVPALAAVATVRDVGDVTWRIVIRGNAEKAAAAEQEAPAVPEPKRPVTVRFTGGKAQLSKTTRGQLVAATRYLRANPDVRVRAVGYTDNGLDAKARSSLGMLRAVAVLRYLNDHGVSPGAVAIESRGAKNPVASNRTAAGRAKNRRVEIVLVKEKES